ncbi:MAG TPA: signal peptidase I [Patescibacteria group bacterium]|nr:signal peptidase I [Patescibacteria group bacterium]
MNTPPTPPPEPLLPSTYPASEPVGLSPEPTASPTASDPSPSAWREIFSTVGILLLAFLVAVFIIAFVFRSYQVDGPSMESTLQNQDKLIIWKVPRTWARITHHAYIPKRGDIIVFEESGLSAFGQADTKQLIKRVVGLPGDHVVVKDNVVTIYNKANPNGFQPDLTLGYNSDHHIPPTSGDVDVTLGAGQLFVCGDNRPDSLDSRTFGPINANQVIGQLIVRVFPINQIKTF